MQIEGYINQRFQIGSDFKAHFTGLSIKLVKKKKKLVHKLNHVERIRGLK